MGELTSISDYIIRRNVVAATPASGSYSTPAATATSGTVQSSNATSTGFDHLASAILVAGNGGGSALNAAVLQKVDPEANIARFLDVTRRTIEKIDECIMLLNAKKHFDADDLLMATKPLFAEIYMHREISDSVGLVALACMQKSSNVGAVTDAPRALAEIRHALNRLWAAPFMSFMEASNLSDQIMSADAEAVVPGYNEIALELIGDAEVTARDPE
jgi:hypothetical protein